MDQKCGVASATRRRHTVGEQKIISLCGSHLRTFTAEPPGKGKILGLDGDTCATKTVSYG